MSREDENKDHLMKNYDTLTFLSYPRPETKIDSAFLPSFQAKGWIAQYKRNGTASEIFVTPEREVKAMTRHGENHKIWSWSKESAQPFRSLPGIGWWVFAGELLHSKVKGGPKDTHYMYDCMVAGGRRLIGKTYQERYEILLSAFGVTPDTFGTKAHYIVTPKLWVAKNHLPKTSNFSKLYSSLTDSIDEGLVLKDPKSILSLSGDNSGFVKCRRPTKHSPF